MTANSIRIRGLVQGVGFRPTVWRIARDLKLHGDVRNDGEGVLVRLFGDRTHIDAFCEQIRQQCPPLARIDTLELQPLDDAPAPDDFQIIASDQTAVHTGIGPDAATCPACLSDIFDPDNRRYRYPLTNCTHCGPRLSIVRKLPYDRANTSMAPFPQCPSCLSEYEDPADRRFHAQPNACADCGPRVWLQTADGKPIESQAGEVDCLATASRLLAEGKILAIKGLGGFHLACDASNTEAVTELRQRKRRFHKPFALMARDIGAVRRYVDVSDEEAELLSSPGAPALLLPRHDQAPPLADDIAPGQHTLGFMLPYTPLHHLLLANWQTPLVMTSGNLSDEPQCIDNQDVNGRLSAIADAFLLHDRAIENRVDDSVMLSLGGKARFIRRARGYAPLPIALHPDFADAPPILALGGELKNTICLLKDGQAIPSQHLGDLEDARTADEFERTIGLYRQLYQHDPTHLAIDRHPNYRSSQLGREWAQRDGLNCLEIQHHHAHIASVLADNGRGLDGGPILGIALDGLGYGDDDTLWGGEFLLADYRSYRRLSHINASPLPGGVKAILEPWRNTYAHIHQYFGWEEFLQRWPGLSLTGYLADKPLKTLDTMMEQGLNSPLSSSCGRLFDAAAAALNIQRDAVSYEGQAAIELETLAQQAPNENAAYPLGITPQGIDPTPLWEALFNGLARGEDKARIAMRFHNGLIATVCRHAAELCVEHQLSSVALSGGVFQNRLLFEGVEHGLEDAGLEVLSQHQVPSNDGGLSLGQVCIAAARSLG